MRWLAGLWASLPGDGRALLGLVAATEALILVMWLCGWFW